MKKCTICLTDKALSEFRERVSKGKVRVTPSCKECERARNRLYYSRNSEGMKRQARQYYLDNKEKVLGDVKLYRDSNRHIIQEKGREYYRRKLKNRMLNGSRARAKKYGIEHDISEADFEVPEMCPLLEIPLIIGHASVSEGSPSLDRIDPQKGYVKGNVWVISHKANTMKSNASLEEIHLFYRNINRLLSPSYEILDAASPEEEKKPEAKAPTETILTSDEIPF